MKKLLLYAMLIITAQSQSQTITDLLNDTNLKYTSGVSINGDELLLVNGSEFVYSYDLTGSNATLNEKNIGIEDTKALLDIITNDEHVYLHISDNQSNNFKNSKIIRRDLSDLISNEEVLIEDDDIDFIQGFSIKNDFLYYKYNDNLRRMNLNNTNQIEDYFIMPAEYSEDYLTAYTFYEDKFYYAISFYDEKELIVYRADASDPMGSAEQVVFLDTNPDGVSSIQYLEIIDDTLYFAINEYDVSLDLDFYSLQRIDLSEPNANPVEITSGNDGYFTSFSVYNNLLHFTLTGESVSKLARVENTLSTPNINRISNFKITPNPNNGIFSLKGLTNAEIQQVTVFDIAGREVYKSQEDVVLNNEIDLGLNLSSGTYILELETVNGVSRQKMVINKAQINFFSSPKRLK